MATAFDDAPPEPDLERGARLALLLLSPRTWVRRRVETVRFTEDGLARRYVSVDTLLDAEQMPEPQDAPEPPGAGGSKVALCAGESSGRRLVPLASLRKMPLGLLDVIDDSGRNMSVLGTTENGYFAYSALAAHAAQVLKCDLPAHLKRCLFSIALDSPADARKALKDLRRSANTIDRALSNDPLFLNLASELTENFILLAEVSAVIASPVRRIFKFSYTVAPDRRNRRKLLDWLLRPHERHFEFRAPAVAKADSYHFQFIPPSGVVVSRTRMDLVPPFEDAYSEDGAVVGGTAHLHTRGTTLGTKGVASVFVAPSTHGTNVTAMVVASGIIFALLGLLWWAHLFTGFPEAGSDDWQALVIALPGVAAGLLAHDGELGVKSRLLAEARGVLGTTAVLALFIALGPAVGVPTAVLRYVLPVAVVVSGLCFTRLLEVFWMAHRATEASGG